MRTLISTIVLALACCQQLALAQCTFSIPANAIVVLPADIPDTVSGNSENVWLCGYHGLIVVGDSNTVYAELPNVVVVQGDNNVVYTNGSNVGISAGSDGTIVHTSSSGYVMMDQGTNTQILVCPGLNYDYSNAPVNGCAGVGIEEMRGSTHVLSNPFADLLVVSNDGTKAPYEVIGMNGKRITSGILLNGRNTIDLSGAASGVYLLLATMVDGLQAQRIVKQ